MAAHVDTVKLAGPSCALSAALGRRVVLVRYADIQALWRAEAKCQRALDALGSLGFRFNVE